MSKLKNATSSSKGVFDKIQMILAENGAKKVMMDYAGDGTLESITFAIELNGKLQGFRLPAMVENVFQVMYGESASKYAYKRFIPKWKQQAYQTAWANIRDWIDAQMALVKTRQADVAQVFLPYMIMKDQKTLYESVVTNPGFLLGEGQ